MSLHILCLPVCSSIFCQSADLHFHSRMCIFFVSPSTNPSCPVSLLFARCTKLAPTMVKSHQFTLMCLTTGMYGCMNAWTSKRVHPSFWQHRQISVLVREGTNVWMSVCLNVSIYVSMYTCMYVCMNERMNIQKEFSSRISWEFLPCMFIMCAAMTNQQKWDEGRWPLAILPSAPLADHVYLVFHLVLLAK